MARDDRTLDFYAREATAYASRGEPASARRLDAFLARLPAGGSVLELGCGAGQDSEYMLARGFAVRPTDGCAEMAAAAEARLGVPVATLLFGDLQETATCDGIWANACLLHVPTPDLGGVLARIHRALRPGGVFQASYKTGDDEGRDRFDRYYNRPSEADLRRLYAALPWVSLEITSERGGGYDGVATDWLHVVAIRRPSGEAPFASAADAPT